MSDTTVLSIITAAVAGAHGDPEDLELDDEPAVKRRADPRAGHLETVPITLDREIIGWVKSQTVENGDAGGTVLVERAVQPHASVARITGTILTELPEGKGFSRLLMRLREQQGSSPTKFIPPGPDKCPTAGPGPNVPDYRADRHESDLRFS